jgi:exopolysaccharide biosynthesis protein
MMDRALAAATAMVPAAVTATAAPATAPPAPETPSWSYQNERIAVQVEQHTRGDFVYFAADIQLTDAAQFAYAFAGERYGSATEPLSDIADRHSPVLAINGDYYSFHDNGIIIRGGERFRAENSSRALLIVENDGDLRVMTDRSEAQSRVANRLMEEGVLHTFEFGPVLVHNGEPVSLKSSILRVGNEYLEPRTAIGQLGPLHYLVIVVDGRSEGYSEGCSLSDLRALFVEYGAQVAFNLDGGGSTTLWFDGKVINRPAAGEEREVSDIVMFMP